MTRRLEYSAPLGTLRGMRKLSCLILFSALALAAGAQTEMKSTQPAKDALECKLGEKSACGLPSPGERL